MTTHTLKTWPVYFQELWAGRKRFELRIDDRGFAVGDILELEEFDPESGRYTSRVLLAKVSYIARDVSAFGLMPGHVIMSLVRPEWGELE